jgi:protocatechuate 3,4-dioxygenase beta subunit
MARGSLRDAGIAFLCPLALFTLLLAPSRAAAQGPARSSPASTDKKDECSIVGMVVKLGGSEPLTKARVRLQSVEDRTRAISVVTNAGGRFELKGIDPGRYRLTVSRVGFVTQEYGQKKSDDPGAVLALRPGQELKDLLFRLIPSGVIAGRILDEDGEPLPSVNVAVAREVYSEGKRALSMGATVETNDLGEYRLFGLSPGRYFVSAVYPRWSRFAGSEDAGGSESDQQGYAKMYYPGTAEAGKAISIDLKGGEEVPSIEILLRKVLTYRIRGRAYNQITHKPGTGTNLLLMPKTNRREWDSVQPANVEKQDGSFDIPEVLPGSYVLTAFWFDEGKIYSTRMPIEVGNADVDGVAVTIAPGMNINGQIFWDGKPALEKDELTVRPKPVDVNFGFQGSTRVTQGNLFTLKDIGEGTYHAEVAGESKDCYIKDVQYGASSVLEDGFTVVRGAPATLEIRISSHGARVQGAVSDADGLPAAGVWVVLVPEMKYRTQHRLYRTQTTDQYGHFDLRGISPGDYKLFSWEEVESGAWEDPEFVKPFEEKGGAITLQIGDQKMLNLVTIPTKSQEEAKP